MGENLDSFLDELCTRHQLLVAIFVLAITLIVIQLPVLVLGPGEDAAVVISTINLVGFAAFALVSGVMLRHCSRRTQSG